MRLKLFFSFFLLTALPAHAESSFKKADLQFFGDLYIPYKSIKQTESTSTNPKLFNKVKSLLSSSYYNIVNFEGVSSGAKMSPTFKRYNLKMPLWIGETLRRSHINVATLGNNHSLDYGYQGLFDTQVSLEKAGIQTFGAGENIDEAKAPLIIQTPRRTTCLISLSRVLPRSFWATTTKPGTAFLSYKQTAKSIKKCSAKGYFTAVIFHWGQESIKKSKTYQRELAKLSIKAGADVVIGHHPHILQEISSYMGKPIFYSIGNFAFGSYTKDKPQEGASVRVYFDKKTKKPRYELVPINVQNSIVKYVPQLFPSGEKTPIDEFIPSQHCKKSSSSYVSYHCNIQQKYSDAEDKDGATKL